MYNIYLFVEDFGHETVIKSFLQRFAESFNVHINILPRSTSGGHGKMIEELKLFIRDLKKQNTVPPDLLIVARDANCKGFVTRKNEIEKITQDMPNRVVYAIPDPHIERWLLLDSLAFKIVLGKGCNAPDQKCDRGRYKKLLQEAVRNTGRVPLLGGMEHAEDIVNNINIHHVESIDPSISHFLKDLRRIFTIWSQSNTLNLEEE